MKIKVISTGHYVPNTVMTNDDFSQILETNDEWITTRTGIKKRHIIKNDENVVDLAYKAALDAINKNQVDINEIDLIVVATITNQVKTPSVANLVQAKLGLNSNKVVSFDINAACSGFVYALEIASSLINTSSYKKALVIGAEHMSSIIDYTDRSTAILFGDGSGAAIIEKSNDENDNVYFYNGAKGDDTKILWIDPLVKMDGKEVYKFAVDIMPKAVDIVLQKANLTIDDIDVIIPHQANLRIIQNCAKDMGLPLEKFIINIQDYGNTSSASIPISLDNYLKNRKSNDKKKVLFVGFGGGFTWGASIINI